MRPCLSRVAFSFAALLAAGVLFSLDSPFRPGTESFRPPDLAPFGEELTAALEPSALESAMSKGAFMMTGLPLSDGQTVDVDLAPFSPFAPGARIIAMTAEGPVDHPISQDRRYFKGRIPHQPDSAALFVFWKDGFSGFVDSDGRRYMYGTTRDADGRPLAAVTRYDPARTSETAPGRNQQEREALTGVPPVPPIPAPVPRIPSSTTLRAELALDLDYEAYTHFGSVGAAADYTALLVTAVSIFFERDANTCLAIKELTVWTSTASPYPYTGTSQGTLMDQLKLYYQTNKGGLVRAAAHLLSMKPSLGGGLAWEGPFLCNNIYGYGVNVINGDGAYPTTAYTWDAASLAHLLGHNFGSKHSNCYQKDGVWLDCCLVQSGCCPTLSYSRGTLMSYCQGGLYGIDMVFGPTVGAVLRAGAVAGACVLEEGGSPGTIGGDGAYWAANGLKAARMAVQEPMAMVLDNGSYGASFPVAGTGQMAFINRLTPPAYPATLNRIEVLFNHASLAPSRPIRLLIYLEPTGSGNPGASSPLYYISTTIQTVSPTTWNSYGVGPFTIASGDVYIGVHDWSADAADTAIAAYDTGAGLSRSYSKVGTSSGATGYTLRPAFNWMVRGYGTVTDRAHGVRLTWGEPCNASSKPGQKYAVYLGALSQLPVEGYDPAPLECYLDAQTYDRHETGDAYFTVVPMFGMMEGGHGFLRALPTAPCGTSAPDAACP